VLSIDPELLEKLIDMEEIDEDSVNDSTDESVIGYLKSTQEKDSSVMAEHVKFEMLAKVYNVREGSCATRHEGSC
jgi:hypothetical protein